MHQYFITRLSMDDKSYHRFAKQLLMTLFALAKITCASKRHKTFSDVKKEIFNVLKECSANFNADSIFTITKFHDFKWLNNFASFLCCVHLECTQERKTIKLLMQKLCDNLVQTVYWTSSTKYADIFAFQIVFFMLQSDFFSQLFRIVFVAHLNFTGMVIM